MNDNLLPNVLMDSDGIIKPEKLFKHVQDELPFQADFLVKNDNSLAVFEIKYNNPLMIFSISD